MRYLLILLGGSIPFLLTVGAVYKANYREVNRYRQLFLPLIAIVYGIVLLARIDGWNAIIQSGIEFLTNLIPAPFLADALHTGFAEAIVFNCLFMLAFAVVKVAYKAIMLALRKPYDEGMKGLFGTFYAYDDDFSHWYLRDEYVGVRRLFKNLFIAAVVIAVVLFVASAAFEDLPAFRNPFYPAYAIVLLGEIFYFLDGMTKSEYEQRVEFEDDHAVRVLQYSKVQKTLDHYFGDRLLSSFSRGRRREPSSSHHDFCEDLIRSDNFNTRVAGAYFMALVDKGMLGKGSVGDYDELSHDAVLNTIKLLDGKSVMFATPFYRDFTPYVFLPLNAQLMRNGKVVVLYGGTAGDMLDEEDGNELGAFVEEGLAFVTNVKGMWDIGRLSGDGGEQPDVALVPFSALGDTRLVLNNADYFKQVGFALVIDPSSMLATYQVGLSILAEYLSAGREVAYCVFDRNSDGLVDSLSHALRTNLTEVGATEFCEGTSVGMMWDVDGEFLQHRLFPDVAHYLGVGSEIGLVALRGQVSKVAWAGAEAVPLVDQRWILGQYYGELFRFAELPQEQGRVDQHFEFYPDCWSMRKEPHRFVVAEDEYRNLFEAYRQFTTRGTEQAFVNVLSPNYLLRDYMVDNVRMFVKDPKAIPAIAPDFSKSQRNVVFSIVMMMAQGEQRLLEQDVAARLKYAGALDGRSVQEALEGMLVEHFPCEEGDDLPESHIVVSEEPEYVAAQRAIVTRRYYSLSTDARMAAVFQALRCVPLVTEAPDGTQILLGSRLYGHVNQMFLPGQFVSIGGKYYEVVSVSSEAGVMLRRAADHFTRRRYYRQLRRYVVSEWEDGAQPGDMRTIGALRMQRGIATVEVSTMGYLDCGDFGDVVDAKRVELSGVPRRRHIRKDVLRLDFEDAGEHVATTIAVIMSELFKTLYPKDHSFIAVLAPGAEEGAVPEGVLYECECPEDGNVLYIVEDSLIDIGLLSSIGRNIPRILEACWDYLDWHEGKMAGRKDEQPPFEVGEYPGDPEPYEPPKGIIRRLLERLFGGGGKKKGGPAEGDGPDVPAAAMGVEPPSAPTPETEEVDEPEFEVEAGGQSETEPTISPESGYESDADSEPELDFDASADAEPELGDEPPVSVGAQFIAPDEPDLSVGSNDEEGVSDDGE